jgi:hypothetical protein
MRGAVILGLGLTFFNSYRPSSAGNFNLGNAQFLADQLPEAIFSYRRGLLLDPNDADLRENLTYALAKVAQPYGTLGKPEADVWPSWLYQPSPFQTAAAFLLLYGVACILVTRWFMTRRRGLLYTACVGVMLTAISGWTWLYLQGQVEWDAAHPLVVIREDKLPLRKGNGPSYPVNSDMPLLARGMEARQIGQRGGWLQIQFAAGPVGWVEKSAVIVDDRALSF